jgi:hypothetical protein
MTRILTTVGDVIAIFRSAVATASALENGRRPLPGDLRRLGIDVAAFGHIARG